MSTLTRRNPKPGEPKQRSNSLWEQEANNYWQEMEPAKRYKKISGYVVLVLLAFVVVGGVTWSARSVWNHTDLVNLALLKERFFPLAAKNATPPVSAPEAPVATPAHVPAVTTEPISPTPTATAPAKSIVNDPAAVDLLRARCRVRGVQTRWHEETCRKLCTREPQNTACMNGCSFGSITVTKLTCDQMDLAAIATATKCPEGVSCVSACKAYEHEAPVPATRVACERACTNVVASSCSRILQIYRDLYKGALH